MSIPTGKKIFISGKSLAECREKAGLTQAQLAEKLGKTRVTVSGWEAKEKVAVTEKELELLETLLDVKTGVLTNGLDVTLDETEILDHPVIKSLVNQSDYILKRVSDLEKENEKLRKRLGE